VTSTGPGSSVVEHAVQAPRIRRLEICRFRGINHLVWNPSDGLNLILGGGDVGKTTVLDAIALLLSPSNTAGLSDAEYHLRDITSEFSITAVMSLPDNGGVHYQTKASWPWEWNGTDAVHPSVDGETQAGEPVYCLRVRGTSDLELSYEIVQPDGGTENLSYAMRRAIGLVRLGGDDRNDRDLRLVQGSALDRLLSDKGLRSRMTNQLAQSPVSAQLEAEAKTTLAELENAFAKKRLPTGLDIAVTGGAGPSIASMVGLTAQRQAVALPLTSWGAGTRRLAALAIAEKTQSAAPIVVVDEVERGLEPYRQKALAESMILRPSQSFVTTHSPFVIRSAAKGTLWYLAQGDTIGAIKSDILREFVNSNPMALLARLTVIVEGVTELGFVGALLTRALGGDVRPFGIEIAKGNGHERTRQLLDDLRKVGLTFGGFADEEKLYPEVWARIKKALGPLLFRWKAGCIEQNIIGAIPEAQLLALITDADGEKTGERLQSIAKRLGCEKKDFPTLQAEATAASQRVGDIILQAALGQVPDGASDESKKEFKRHAGRWFKTFEGGCELEAKMFALGVWPQLKVQLLPFCNAVRESVGLASIVDLPT